VSDTSIQFAEPWHAIDDATQASAFVAELQREVSSDHPLSGQSVAAVACRSDCDDVLFQFGSSPERFAVVHLTWSGRREATPQWPSTKLFDTLSEFAETRMKEDAFEL
jgi:hypothetical protein